MLTTAYHSKVAGLPQAPASTPLTMKRWDSRQGQLLRTFALATSRDYAS